MNPRARASFCHWPKLTSTPPGQVGPSCVSRPAGSRATTSSAPARRTAVVTAGPSSRRGRSPTPTEWRAGNSKRKKSWNAPARSGAPVDGRHRREIRAVDQDAPAGRRVQLGQQLHQRGLAGAVLADDRHHRPRRQVERHVVEHQPVGARIGERDVIEPHALRQSPRRRLVGRGHDRRRVVLEPGQAPRRVHPDAAQEADLADRGADVERQPRSRGQREQHVARRRASPGGDEDDRADVAGAEDRPRRRVPRRRGPARRRDRRLARLPGLPSHPQQDDRRCR